MILYFINLEKDHQRLKNITHQLDKQLITYRRIAGIDARKLSEAFKKDFALKRKSKKTPWLDGQIGCFLSHFKAWEMVAQSQDMYAVILEDDVHLSNDFGKFIHASSWIPNDANILRLETSTNYVLLNKKTSFLNRNISKVTSTTWLAGGYIISKETAKFLISLSEQYHHTVDALLFSRELSSISKDLIIYQIDPAIVQQDKYSEDSIGLESNIEETPSQDHILSSNKNYIKKFIKYVTGYKKIQFK
jgi:glycosyl transferase family 25